MTYSPAYEFEKIVSELRGLIDTIPTIPGYDPAVYEELDRDFEDLVDRAKSLGRKRKMNQMMWDFYIKLRSLKKD